jgi:hypothetical protein
VSVEPPDPISAIETPASDSIAPDVPEMVELEPPALVPVTVYHGGADVLVATGPDEAPRQSAVEARLGSELLNRVRARYAEISARIRERVGGDPVRLEEMRRAVEALNPDIWVTEAEIAAGLQQFDARLGEIRRALGIKRRRRSRRGGRHRRGRGREQAAMPTAEASPVRSTPDLTEAADELEIDDEETDD